MGKLSLYISLFFVFVCIVLSDPNIPLRGTLKDLQASPEVKCENSFVMWFGHGVPITTIKCGEYSTIYSGKSNNGGVEKRYIKGEVTTVVINAENDIKINNVAISEISTDSGEPTDSATLSVRKTADVDNIKVYSFPLGEKSFDVYLPNKASSTERTEYTLGYKETMFYTGDGNNSKYTLEEDGDLVNSSQQVVLPKDPSGDDVTQESTDGTSSSEDLNGNNSTSSASKIMYVIPSFSAALASILLL